MEYNTILDKTVEVPMIQLTITENEQQQRLDRFLKKYFRNAPLSRIYKMIRKDVKVNGNQSQSG